MPVIVICSFHTHGRETKSVVPIICIYVMRVPVCTALKFGKQTVSFQFYNLRFDTYTIIYGVKLLSFGISYFRFPYEKEMK